ncbi:hypothetical protein HYH03_018174 [Edaphochlamys debaryana]|uniref:SET domain-containing protein n=1 Tax=Edaphochlamys debaryana TaxID=47281 RepID=A0A836BPP4_9CHLO|nr:hypothetical protein HYH03_018174 [Edaphochlamys debaryana]|eukprot:KAG2482949.1 hypothetical protein HYH03_018174 [Edaphochlamys debaryana]
MFFSREAIDAIDYMPVTQQVKKRCKWLYEFSTQVLAPLPGSPADPFGGARVDINALGWALACVSSRAFRTRGPSHPAALLPLVDMANHSFDPNAEVLPVEGGGVGLFARKKMSAGEPVLLSYGKLGNDFLFMDYGFVMGDNPYDVVQLRFDPGLLQAGALVANVTDALGAPLDLSPAAGGGAAWRGALLAELGLVGPAADTELRIGAAEEPLDPRLLAAARVLAARSEGEVAGRGAARLCAVDRPLSRGNEEAALRAVGGALVLALGGFGTSLDQDLALLGGSLPPSPPAPAEGAAPAPAPTSPLLRLPGGEDEALAVRFRAEKKRALQRGLARVAELVRAASGDAGLKQTAGAGRAPKGSKPAPSTGKGFGGGGKK